MADRKLPLQDGLTLLEQFRLRWTVQCHRRYGLRIVILELLSFTLTGYRRIMFASYGLRMSRIELRHLAATI